MKTITQHRKAQMNGTCIVLYERIAAYWKQFGHAPSLRDMCKLMNINSTSYIAGLLRVLEDWKWIEQSDGSHAMRLTRVTEVGAPLTDRQMITDECERIARIADTADRRAALRRQIKVRKS